MRDGHPGAHAFFVRITPVVPTAQWTSVDPIRSMSRFSVLLRSVIPYLYFYAFGALWDHTLLLPVNSRQLVWKWLKPRRALFRAKRRKKSNRWCSASRGERRFKGCGSINRPYLAGDITSGLTKVNWRRFKSNCILKGILWWANSAHNQNVYMELLLLKC